MLYSTFHMWVNTKKRNFVFRFSIYDTRCVIWNIEPVSIWSDTDMGTINGLIWLGYDDVYQDMGLSYLTLKKTEVFFFFFKIKRKPNKELLYAYIFLFDYFTSCFYTLVNCHGYISLVMLLQSTPRKLTVTEENRLLCKREKVEKFWK